MKREEKVQLTGRKIMDNALKEFLANGYGAGSVNNIFDPEQGISKGIIYHSFSSKDELFLACVGECFEQLKSYIEKQFVRDGDTMTAEECFNRYFAVILPHSGVSLVLTGIAISALKGDYSQYGDIDIS